MTPLKVKLLHEKAVLPVQTTEGAAGLDLTATSEEKIYFVGTVPVITYGTGVAVEIPKGYVGLLFPRSSVATQKTLSLGNSCGIIDSDFSGEIKVVFKELSTGGGKKYAIGDRIAQLVIVPFLQVQPQVVTELTETKRGQGGFGSSGK